MVAFLECLQQVRHGNSDDCRSDDADIDDNTGGSCDEPGCFQFQDYIEEQDPHFKLPYTFALMTTDEVHILDNTVENLTVFVDAVLLLLIAHLAGSILTKSATKQAASQSSLSEGDDDDLR